MAVALRNTCWSLLALLAWFTPARAQDATLEPPASEAAPGVDAVPPPASVPLWPGLDHPQAIVRQRAVVELGRAPQPAQVAHLARLLREDPAAEVRARAAWALGEANALDAEPALIDGLRQDTSRRVRRACALALGELDTVRAHAALAAALEDEDARVAAAAVEGLARSADPAMERVLRRAAALEDPLPSLTARRALARLERNRARSRRPSRAAPQETARKPAAPPRDWRAAYAPCRDGAVPPDCIWTRNRSDRVKADALFVGGGTGLGALGGLFFMDAVRPYRRGVRVTPERTTFSDNTSSPLERSLFGALGAGVGLAAAGSYALLDDLTLSRVGLIGLLTAQGVGMGAGLALAFNAPRNVALLEMGALGATAALAGTLLTSLPGDVGYGDVAFVVGNAALGFGLGALLTIMVIPAGVGRDRGKEGYVVDVADLLYLPTDIYRLPWGPMGRVELGLAGGLLTSGLTTEMSLLAVPVLEVGVSRMLKTVGAATLAAMVVGLPVAVLLPPLPAPLPTPDRFAAGLAVLSGATAGLTVFALSSNEDELGPLIAWGSPRARPAAANVKDRTPPPAVTLGPPSVGILAPPPVALAAGTNSGAGLYLGLVNARF